MRAHQRALGFAPSNQLGGLALNDRSYEIVLRCHNGPKPCDVYVPPGQTPVGTIIVLHGMALRGRRDPRIVETCCNLTTRGFRVLAPELPDVAALELNIESTHDIKGAIRAIARRPELCPGGRFSLFAPSFSAGIAIAAANTEDLCERVNAVFTLGAPGHLGSTLEYLFGADEVDTYGMMIVLKSLGQYAFGRKAGLLRAFELAAIDGSFEPPPPQLPDHLEKNASRKEREIFERVMQDRQFRLEALHQILDKNPELCDTLDIVSQVDNIRGGVSLVHGEDDRVIPPAESVALHARMQERGVESRLEVTPLVGHGGAGISPNMALKVPGLLAALAFFFKRAADRE